MSPQQQHGWRGVSLKKELVDSIERILSDYPDLGYKSVGDFVADATRRRMEEVKKLYSSTSP